MIKRLIFDLDDTLIKWLPEYVSAVNKSINEFNLNIDGNGIDEVIKSLENTYNYLTKDLFLNEINNSCNLNMNIDFVDSILENQKLLAPADDFETIDTIKYLSSKYELVLLTNWFADCQAGRLETLGIKKYFKEFYGADIVPMKPDPNSYKLACGPYKIEECIMIGDNAKIDIEGALNVGMKVIKCDFYNRDNNKYDYPVIKKISDLKEML